MSPVSQREYVESVPSSARALGLSTVFFVYDQRRRENNLYSPKGGNIHGPPLHGNRGEHSGMSWEGQVWQAPCLLTAKHLWQNILESWNLVKNDFRKSFQGNRKSLLTQLSKSQMEHIS